MVAYLDYNASAPIEVDVLDYMIDIYKHNIGNANSRTHIYGNKAKEIVEKSRKTLAELLSLDQMEVIFTSGSTESNNMAILGLLDYAKKTGKTHFITTAIEHKAVLKPMEYLENIGFDVDYVYPDASGRVSVKDVIDRVNDKTALVSVMHVNSETGIIQPVEEVGQYLKDLGVYFHIDATQSFGKMNDVLRNLKYDMLSISSHKICGPQGVGALVLKTQKDLRKNIKALMLGGGQEYNFRPGTLPVALIGGFGMASEIYDIKNEIRKTGCQSIKKQFLEAIAGMRYSINGDPQFCVSNTINISFNDVDAEAMFNAVKNHYAVSNGSACESGTYANSYVLKAMGFDDKRISEAIRLSWDYKTQVDFSELVLYVKGQQFE